MVKITFRVPNDINGRLLHIARRSGKSVSEVLREMAIECIERYESAPKAALSRELLDELLISVFGMEELVVRSYDPAGGCSVDREDKREMLIRVDARARKKTDKLLAGNPDLPGPS